MHVVASLRLFELTGDPRDFPRYIDLNRLPRRGETTKICLTALAEEGPLDTRELAQRVMRAMDRTISGVGSLSGLALRHGH